MSRDPYDIPTPRQRPDDTPDPRREFWQQVPDMRPTVKKETPATGNTCRFDPQNKRAYHPRGGCIHFPDGF